MEPSPFDCQIHIGLHARLSPQQVAELYRPLGWRIRKCSWVDYEIRCEWAELVIEDPGDTILMHGPLADGLANADRILGPLRKFGVTYEGELYDENGELLQQLKWDGA
jgi:hypothetical protein